MEVSNMNKFLGAIEEAEITDWVAIVDTPTNFYNNDTQFNLFDEEEAVLINCARPIASGTTYFEGDIVVKAANLVDIHELRIGGSYDKIKRFIDAYGLTLTEDQNKKLLEIYNSNYNLNPATGDYNFRKLTNAEISKLSPEEKTKYENELKEYEKSQMRFTVRVD